MNAIELSRFYRAVLHCGALVRVHEGEKGPFDVEWPLDSKMRIDEWERRLDGWSVALLFLPTGARDDGRYLLVVDADLYKIGAADSLAELYALGLPRRTATALTPRGGEHLYYVVDEPIPSGPLEGFPGIDIKCVGGGVRVYEWEHGYGLLDEALPHIDSPILLGLLRGEVRGAPEHARTPRTPSLVDRLAVQVLVEHAGAHSPRWTGRGYAITRPGKERGPSATVGVIFPGGIHVFSSSWPSIPPGSYTLHELCALLGVPDPMVERMRALADGVGAYKGPELGAHFVSLDTVTPERVDWLWPWRIPRGRLTMLEGDPSIGKSTLALDIAATVTRGGIFADGAGVTAGTVLVLTAEDNLADTVAPRLLAAGARLDRVVALVGEYVLDAERGRVERAIALPASLPLVEELVIELEVVLVIVDVLAAYVQIRGDVYRDTDVRSALLSPLASMAERTSAAVLLLRHLTKAHGANPLYAGGGSIGITGAARSMLLAALHPELEGVRVLAHAKSNLSPLAPSLAYGLESSEEHECGRIAWKGECELGAAALLSGPSTGPDDEGESKLEEAKLFLASSLAAGPMQSSALDKLAELQGVELSRRTLARARRELGVIAEQAGRHWIIRLPEGESE